MSANRIAQNIEMIRRRVQSRCLKNNVDASSITIVGISKTFPASAAESAVRAGLADLGENRVQEAAAKIPEVSPRPRWHLVGHLQKNKVKKAVELFDIVQSVDSLELAFLISEQAGMAGKIMEIYLQVNSSYEPQKSGFDPVEILKAAEKIAGLANIKITGLMTIGPMTDDTKEIARSFSLTGNLFGRVREIIGSGFERLSMGMSGDFELAIDHGANVLRIGTAIFGERGME
jgi:PLP dependent protein